MSEALETRVLLAATLTRFDSAAGSSGFTNEFVRMDLGDFKVDIDTRYGGTPSRWYNGFDPNSVTNPFAGEGVTVMWDQGNDPTQGSASGPGANPIARLDGQQLSYNYYGRETLFDNGGGNSSTVGYEVTGFAPFFWISHEAGDDAIPVDSLPRWRTLYNNPGDSSQITSDPSVPIFYQATGTPDGAVMFIGDDVVVSGTSWSQRLAEMREGRFAAKVRVSLQNAGSDAIAGLMFRRQIPDAVNVSEAAAYSSPGYTLNVNKSGKLEIVRVASQGASPAVVWESAPGAAASTINTAAGALLELRTHNANGNVEIFLNGTSIGNYNDPQVLRGAHFGFFATSSTGEIKFSDRQVFDVGTEYVARYTGHENGVMTTDIQIRNVAGVSTPNQIYFAQTPSVWLGNTFRSDATARFLDSSGNTVLEYSTGAVASKILRGDDGDANTQEPYALWLGSNTSNKGIFAVPQAAWVNGAPAGHPHAQIDVNNSGRYVVSMNPLPQYPSWPPTSQDQRNSVTSLRMVTDWRPKLETIAPLLASIGDQTVTEGNSGQKMATFTVSLNRMPTQFVSIPYATSPGTAISGVDFVATTGTLVFDPADGLLSKTISVPVVGETSLEANELFRVNLSAPKNAAIGDGEGIGTIVNDDTPTTTNIPPTVAGFDTLVSWTENAAAVVLDTNATVSDPDSPNFSTGKLTVSLTAGAQTTDRLSIRNQGTLAGQISVAGNSVRFGGTAIGTLTGTGIGTAPLIVTLNTAATAAAVQALLRNVTFASVSENPSVLNRTVQVTLSDGDGGTSTPVSKSIRVIAVNDAPVVGAFDTLVTYTENAVPVVLDTNATVADVDSLNLLSGRLTVSLTANGSSTDRLSIRNQGTLAGQIGVVGSSVSFGGIPIGTFLGTTTLTVTLNAAATPVAVQALLRNVGFASVSENPSVVNRTVQVTLTDGDGGTSIPVSKSIRVIAVNDAPVIGAFDGSVSYRAGAAAVVLDTNATVTDVDSPNFAGGRLTFALSQNGQGTDVLGIRNQGTGAGQIGVSGTSIRYGSVVIGTFTGGVGITPLVVTLSAGATPAAVQALLRNVTFRSTATTPVTLVRTVSVSLTDGDGGTSILRSKLVSVLA